jgi:3-phytase
MGRRITVLAAALAATLVAGCTPATGNDPVRGQAARRPRRACGDHHRRGIPFTDDAGRQHRFAAAWRAPDGKLWLIATAKATDKLVVYDGSTGQHLRDVGSSGTAPGSSTAQTASR